MEVISGTTAKMNDITDNQAKHSLDELTVFVMVHKRLFVFLIFFLFLYVFDFHPTPQGKGI